MATIITNFTLMEHLTHEPVISEVGRLGDTWRHKETQITEGVTLFLYDSGQAALEFGGDAATEFLFTEEVAEVFRELRNVTALELFSVLHRNRIVANFGND